MEEKQYQQLAPYILLPEKINYTSKTSSNDQFVSDNNKDVKALVVDINTADTTAFQQLKGIGSVYSNRIVKYRNLLGGFIKVEQLKEVYGLKEETYYSIKPQLILTKKEIIKININTSNANQLRKHPYIDWKLANVIEKYRKANGNYQNIKDLKQIHLINEETFLKIAPYLSIN